MVLVPLTGAICHSCSHSYPTNIFLTSRHNNCLSSSVCVAAKTQSVTELWLQLDVDCLGRDASLATVTVCRFINSWLCPITVRLLAARSWRHIHSAFDLRQCRRRRIVSELRAAALLVLPGRRSINLYQDWLKQTTSRAQNRRRHALITKQSSTTVCLSVTHHTQYAAFSSFVRCCCCLRS